MIIYSKVIQNKFETQAKTTTHRLEIHALLFVLRIKKGSDL